MVASTKSIWDLFTRNENTLAKPQRGDYFTSKTALITNKTKKKLSATTITSIAINRGANIAEYRLNLEE